MSGFRTARVAPEKAAFRPALPLRSMPGLYGADMTRMSYRDQLLSPKWQKRRLEMLEAAKWACVCCGAEEKTLHVHHKRYVKGRMAWDYSDQELAVLCDACHGEEHEARELLDRILTENAFESGALVTAVAVLAGVFGSTLAIDTELESSGAKLDGHSYELGLLAGMASGAGWPDLAKAGRIVVGAHMNPGEEAALRRWEGEKA